MTLIVSDILALKLIKRTVQEYTVEGATFNIMALDKVMKEMVEDCKSHEDMCFYAADNGIFHEGQRYVDMPGFIDEDLIELWGDDLAHIKSDPCVKQRVGEKVCEISGLSDVLDDMLEAERVRDLAEEERVFQLGEHEVAGSTDLGDLPEVDNLSQESLDAKEFSSV